MAGNDIKEIEIGASEVADYSQRLNSAVILQSFNDQLRVDRLMLTFEVDVGQE